MIADLYDFDRTIYKSESGTHFYFYCLRHFPKKLFPHSGTQLKSFLKRYVLHSVTDEEFKDEFYSYLKYIDAEKLSEIFWKKSIKRINPWFFERDKDVATIVCSASPTFQIKPICEMLGVDLLIATRIDSYSGKMTGQNCCREEKVRRIKEEASQYTIRDAYTDDLKKDAPLLSLATRNKYHIVNGKKIKLN
ncbi:MAG: HAD-IB family phosphatase [Clostridia bacterium]|nr:HAD-IB family phosphatase [Clostridia bacterium]